MVEGDKEAMKVLVCGGRDYKDKARVVEVLDSLNAETPISMVIQGGATGADALAKSWALSRDTHVAEVPALWHSYGPSAGPIRNKAMLSLLGVGDRPEWVLGEPLKPRHMVVAFPGGRGTKSMVTLAKDAGLTVMEVL